MAFAEGGARWKAHFDLSFYTRDSILSEIDISGLPSGQKVLVPLSLINLRSEYASLKGPYNQYRSKMSKIKRDIAAFEDHLERDPLIKSVILAQESELKEIEAEYREICSQVSCLKYKIKHYNRVVVPDIKPVSGIIIDRIELKDFFLNPRSIDYRLHTTDLKLDVYKKKNKGLDDYRHDVRRKIKLTHAEKEITEWLSLMYDTILKDPSKYSVSAISMFRDSERSPWMRISFESGLGLELKMVFPFTKKYIFNLITYSKYSKSSYNLVWAQDNYQCLTSCINRISEDLFELYKELKGMRFGDTITQNDLFESPICSELGYTFYNLLTVDIARLLVMRLEVHKNFRFPDKRKQNLFHKGFFLFTTANDKFCNWVKGTAYIEYPNKPKIRVYNKTLELKEKQNVKIDDDVSRIELDMTKKAISNYCGSHSLKDIGYFHPDEKGLPDLSHAHFNELFNRKIDEMYSKLNPFDNFMEFVRIMGDMRWQGINLEEKSIEGAFIDGYNMWDLLNDVALIPKFADLYFDTGIPERTLSRKLAYLSKLGLIEYNRSLRSYYLTSLGNLMISDYSALYALFYAIQKEDGNNSSNTASMQKPQDAPRILEGILIECIKLSWGDPPHG